MKKNSKITGADCAIIISVYKDTRSLDCILSALSCQTIIPEEIIVSEDGNSPEMALYLANHDYPNLNIIHLTQEDIGFYKNRALNRAIAKSRCDYLVFIDGDCIPHRRFIEAHLITAEKGRICCGRRVELGPTFSGFFLGSTPFRWLLQIPVAYLLLVVPLALDRVRNFEGGLRSTILHYFNMNKRHIDLMGCNFSCFKQDLINVNGFNEEYRYPGIGEDTDIQWRLERAGTTMKNIKFLAIQYHIYHAMSARGNKENLSILRRTRDYRIIKPEKGLDQHL